MDQRAAGSNSWAFPVAQWYIRASQIAPRGICRHVCQYTLWLNDCY